jgi:hypothetical protein
VVHGDLGGEVSPEAWSRCSPGSWYGVERWLERLRRPWASVVDEVLDFLRDKIKREYQGVRRGMGRIVRWFRGR